MKPHSTLGRSLALMITLVAIGSSSSASTATDEQPCSIRVTERAFVERLPQRVFISRAEGAGQRTRPTRAALDSLGALPIRLLELPPEAEPAAATYQHPPIYPTELRREGVRGQARFLLLIGRSGELEALYCYDRTHLAFERNAAAALQQWRYSPARVDGSEVPALLEVSIVFVADG